MKNPVKLLVKLGVVLVVLLLVAVIGIMILIDVATKATITHGGTYATQVDTTVGSADLGVLGGTFAMRDFVIANPEGYDQTPYFIQMQATDMQLDAGSVFSETIEVPKLTISGLDMYLDKTQSPGNYNQIIENLKRFESGESPEGAAEEPGGPKVVIRLVEIKDVSVHVAGIPGVQQLVGDVALSVDSIELKDVGEGDPVSLAELITVIIKAVLTTTIEAGGSVLPSDLVGELGSGLEGLGSLAGDGLGLIFEAGEGVGGAAGEVLDGIGDLFGGNKDDDGG